MGKRKASSTTAIKQSSNNGKKQKPKEVLSPELTVEEQIKLANLMETHPVIWRLGEKGYKNNNGAKLNAWTSISTEMKLTGSIEISLNYVKYL